MSRQARHAQLGRARSTAVAGALFLSATDDRVRDFVLSADFTWLRPWSADTQFKWRELPRLLEPLDEQRCARLFEAGARQFLDLSPRVRELAQAEALRIHNALCCLSLGPLLHGSHFADPFNQLWVDARRRDLLHNTHHVIRLSTLGGWAGSDQPLIHATLNQSLRHAWLADLYCFTRSDTRDDIYALNAGLLRGEPVAPATCLAPSHRASTVRQAIDYIRACFRDSQHLRTAGQALSLLTVLTQLELHIGELRAEGLVGDEIEVALQRLQGFARVQEMEKRRFWQLCDLLPDSRTKERLVQLWQRDYGSSYTPGRESC